jgi:transcriptional regulator with XRE-family HTH domain
MPTESLGERLRRLRRAAKKTLQQVAEESGLSVGFLSQVERNLTGVSLSSLAGIARAVGTPMKVLFDHPIQEAPDSHQGLREPFSPVDLGQTYERLSSVFTHSQLHAVKLTLPPGYHSERIRHEGDEFVYVLAGKVRYTVDERAYELGPGDSLHFDGHQFHRLANAGTITAVLISVGTMDLFGDAQEPIG